jgi:membrane protein
MTEPVPLDGGPSLQPERISPRYQGRRVITRARDRYAGSVAEGIITQLRELNFGSQARLFAAGMLVSLLPLLVLLSAFVGEKVEDDIAVHLGLDRRAAEVASHLFRTSPASVNVATVTSLVFVVAGVVAVASSIQQIYEKVFGQEHLGARYLYRRVAWVAALCAVVALETIVAKAARTVGGDFLIEAVVFAIFTPFFWWTMHFLLGGRVGWGRLLPSAVATGLLYICLDVFSLVYFSRNVITDDKLYGPLGTVLSLMTWLAAIGGVIIVGAVAGAVWGSRKQPSGRERALGGPGPSGP